MIALDKEAQTMYLEQFNCEVKLVHHMDMRFFFAVPVSIFRIETLLHPKKKQNLFMKIIPLYTGWSLWDDRSYR